LWKGSLGQYSQHFIFFVTYPNKVEFLLLASLSSLV
jgi:hypothetical protein